MSADLTGVNLRPKPEDPAARFRPGALETQQPLFDAAEPVAPPGSPRDTPAAVPSVTKRIDWQETLKFSENESIASILLKLEQVPGREIAIVAPPDLRVFRNPVSMRLLQRKAQDLGLDVTIVSDDELTRSLCAEIGFGCYGNVKSFRKDNSRPRHAVDEPKIARDSILSVVGGLCLAVLAGFVAFFVMPAANVTVTPVTLNLGLDVPITADSSIPGADVATGRVPAKFVTSGDVDGSSMVTATGQRDMPNQPAKGFVTFTNKTAQPVTIPKATVLLAGKVAFVTTADTQVTPSVTIGGTAIQGQGSAPVQAADPGPDGNVPVGAITAIQGELASKAAVINHGATTGGSNKKGNYLSADDQAKAKQALLSQLRQQALDKLQSQIPPGESFLPNPDADGEGAIEELTYEESPEQVTGQTRLHMRVNLRGLAFQGEDVNRVVAQAVDAAVKQRKDGARLAGSPISIDPPAVVGNDGSTVKLQVHAVGRIVTPVDPAEVARKTRGLSADDARVALLGLPGVGDADVQLWPVWSRKVPSFSWRVHTSVASASS